MVVAEGWSSLLLAGPRLEQETGMAADSSNQQYDQPLFGYGSGWADTGAGGTPGATEAGTMADNAFRVQATMPYQSVQNEPVPMVGVGLDDTGSMGRDQEGISGLGPSFVASTGAGQGTVVTPHHPNAGGGR